MVCTLLKVNARLRYVECTFYLKILDEQGTKRRQRLFKTKYKWSYLFGTTFFLFTLPKYLKASTIKMVPVIPETPPATSKILPNSSFFLPSIKPPVMVTLYPIVATAMPRLNFFSDRPKFN
jgi:hypothetical protein